MDPREPHHPISDLHRLLTGVSVLALVLAVSAVTVGTPIFGGGKSSEKTKEVKEEKQENGAKDEEKGGGGEKEEKKGGEKEKEKKEEGGEKSKDQDKKEDEGVAQPAPAPATSPTTAEAPPTTTTAPTTSEASATTQTTSPTTTATPAPAATTTPAEAQAPATASVTTPTTAESTPVTATPQPETTTGGTTTPTTTEAVAVALEPTGTHWWDATPPEMPTNISVTAAPGTVTLRWLDPRDGDLVTVDILRNIPPSTAVSGIPLTRVPRGEQQYVDASVAPATTYAYILRAQDGSGNVRLSDAVAITTPATPIFRVTGDEPTDSRPPVASPIVRLLYGVDWPDQLEAFAAFIRRVAQ